MFKGFKVLISVIGGHTCDARTGRLAEQVGSIIAELQGILVCGGLTGVMEHAAKGAKHAGGVTVGILPGADKRTANPYIDVPLPTGLGYTRNTLVAGVSDIVVALKGKEGTLSEIGFALSAKKPVVGFKSWKIPGMIHVNSPAALRATLQRLIKNHMKEQ